MSPKMRSKLKIMIEYPSRPYILKANNLAESDFQPKKNWQKKCVNHDFSVFYGNGVSSGEWEERDGRGDGKSADHRTAYKSSSTAFVCFSTCEENVDKQTNRKIVFNSFQIITTGFRAYFLQDFNKIWPFNILIILH